MIEVIGGRLETREVYVMVGLGRAAQWYRNVAAGQAEEVAIGRERFRPDYRERRLVSERPTLAFQPAG